MKLATASSTTFTGWRRLFGAIVIIGMALAFVGSAGATGIVLLDDDFDDSDLGVNTTGPGQGWDIDNDATPWGTAGESGGSANLSLTGGGGGMPGIVSKDTFDPDGLTVTWVLDHSKQAFNNMGVVRSDYLIGTGNVGNNPSPSIWVRFRNCEGESPCHPPEERVLVVHATAGYGQIFNLFGPVNFDSSPISPTVTMTLELDAAVWKLTSSESFNGGQFTASGGYGVGTFSFGLLTSSVKVWGEAQSRWQGDGTLSFDRITVWDPVAPPDSDGDSVPDGADLCPDTPEGEPVDANGCSQSQLDDDGDGVNNDTDLCPDTIIPEETVPTVRLGVNRRALTDADGTFDTTAPRGKGKGPDRSYTIEDTGGCSGEQIIDALNLGKGHTKFGLSISAMDEWVASVNP